MKQDGEKGARMKPKVRKCKTCGRPGVFCRGVCRRDYYAYRRLVAANRTSWRELERAGKVERAGGRRWTEAYRHVEKE